MAEDARPWCNICGQRAPFLFPERGREGLVCPNCSASTRQRALIYALGTWLGATERQLTEWTPRRDMRVLEASGRSAYPALLAEKLAYVNAEYRADPTRELAPFSGRVDLEHLSYADASLDIVLAADVFEHVRHDEQAFREVWRALRPGGLLLLTVPYDADRDETLVRVRVDGDQDTLLMEPEYHGGGGRTLAYRTYGRDLLDRLRRCGFTVGVWELDVPHHAIIPQPIFLAVRGSSIDLGRFHRQPSGAPASSHRTPLVPFRAWTTLKYNLRAAAPLFNELRSRLGG